MAKKLTPHLDFYYRNVETKRLNSKDIYSWGGYGGLCYASGYGRELNKELLGLFYPTDKDQEWLKWEDKSIAYWGSDSNTSQSGVFTNLRQTIVLFMAAMNNEL